MTLLILTICCIIIAIHIVYYVFAFNFFNFSKKKEQTNTPPVSVVVCAKNEAQNLKKLLPELVKQQYPDFELVLINDRSYDETEDIYSEYAEKYSFIKLVNVQESDHFYGNKKYALTLGIKAATNDCLLFTDADCLPKSEFWIQEMASQYNGETKIVLGYGPYQTTANSLLNKLIRYETILTALQYFSFAKLGMPYMGVGRNLLYSKEVFLKNKGFNQYVKIMSGDDDLLINQIANAENTAICFEEQSHMVSAPKTTFKELVTQKRRHISTSDYYKKHHKFILGTYALNRLLFWLILPFSLFYVDTTKNQIFIASLIAFKLISEYIVVGIATHKLKEKKIIAFIPFLDLLLLMFQIYIFICNSVSKPKKWS
ncbi:glycosyltransferase [Wenyingzhuangia aestuarii]|uniref:glycosyltransferase n=1 Tax=Wenyingzhuangia aestuarii TaxID=1647582 RepID=UPI00143AAD00|nr:glycosyltransferase [Wenyingzhuangia aestuarii]NJB81869.1 glycosyltransferase involved in cell wall biosynthesis [Wenyingzhuangia aestuarii]